jgi:8-oxo-dGTP diphosphatase
MDVDRIDWELWRPTERANLCFVIKGGKVLLIRKKRGLGAGKINGPGGRNEKGETPEQAAVRELQEELGITPLGMEAVGELHFQFLDGYGLYVTVFAASDCRGEPMETDEAIPYWIALKDIPYHDMWQDDPHWLPHLLARRRFKGYFAFDGERLLRHRVLLQA